MEDETLGAALEREHREIDREIARAASGDRPGAVLAAAMAALRRHIYVEEEVVFPSVNHGGMMAPLFVMRREHGEMWQTMDALAAAGTGAASHPDSASALVAQLDSHNAKEESIVYAQADALIGAGEVARLLRALESVRMPEGWVCQAVRRST